jgi:hypothetical protein
MALPAIQQAMLDRNQIVWLQKLITNIVLIEKGDFLLNSTTLRAILMVVTKVLPSEQAFLPHHLPILCGLDFPTYIVIDPPVLI